MKISVPPNDYFILGKQKLEAQAIDDTRRCAREALGTRIC